MKMKEWGAFALLGLIWGSSFLWIKIAVQEIGPFTLVAFRVVFGLLFSLAVIRLQRASISSLEANFISCTPRSCAS